VGVDVVPSTIVIVPPAVPECEIVTSVSVRYTVVASVYVTTKLTVVPLFPVVGLGVPIVRVDCEKATNPPKININRVINLFVLMALLL
jgi:hypothetical protein